MVDEYTRIEKKWATIFKAETYLNTIKNTEKMTMLKSRLLLLRNEHSNAGLLSELDTDNNYIRFCNNDDNISFANLLLSGPHSLVFAIRVLRFGP